MINKLRKLTLSFLYIFFIVSCNSVNQNVNYRKINENLSLYEHKYEVGNWNHPDYKSGFESHGNHRSIIRLKNGSNEIHQVIVPWRRRDDNPEKKDIVLINPKTNQPINNKFIIDNNNDFGHILFKPEINSKEYHLYYLPHKSTGGYYPRVEYMKPSIINDLEWNNEVDLSLEKLSQINFANTVSFQSIDEFHSFFPMEIISSEKEVKKYLELVQKEYYLFPEYRKYPIKMIDYLPLRWIREGKHINGLKDKASRGEYYTFQIGVFSPNKDLKDIEIVFSDLKSKSGSIINKKYFTCFNKSGTNLNGEKFVKKIPVKMGKVQPLWFGLQIPKESKIGTHKSFIVIKPEGMDADTVYLDINIASNTIDSYGDNNPENMSRLRWLNSTIGSEKDFIIKPYTPVSISENTISILGREIELNKSGLPENIFSYFSEEMTRLNDFKENILSDKIRFQVKNEKGNYEVFSNQDFQIFQKNNASVEWHSKSNSENFKLNVSGSLEYDGMMNYNIQLIALNNLKINDINLKIPFDKKSAKYMLGLGRKGGKINENIYWKWDVTKHQEGLWLGNVNKGLQYVLRDNNYERPLNTNFYQSKPLNLPKSWYNDSRGGIDIDIKDEVVDVNNYSGEREIKIGDTLNYNVRFLITPFKLIDTKEHFSTRFVHKYVPVDSVIKLNGTIVNVHHANEINPFINYPFYNIDKQKEYIDEAHSKGIRVKLYNTIRELTYKAHELFALKSLGTEIFNDGKGGGHSWLQEHLKKNYHSAWHAVSVNDASILNKGTSRWTNYYIEGINWLAKNNKIDGLYLDDIAFSRSTVKRIASVFNQHRESFVIDLHSANQYNVRDGFINSAFLYMEHFPYVSRLWFGEYFEYDLEPDYWMTEVSGIPFGLTGEMLEKGGRPYHGLVFGMTTRVYHKYNPGNIWKIFEEFNIDSSRMIGYWVENSPVKINNNKIKCTIFQHNDKILISLASWSNKTENVYLNFDWEKINFNNSSVGLSSPFIDGLQDYNTYKIGEKIEIEGNSGIVLILSKN